MGDPQIDFQPEEAPIAFEPEESPAAPAAYAATAGGMTPEDAGAALTHAKDSGLGVDFVAENLPAVRAQAEADKLRGHLERSPAVAAYAGQGVAQASLVKKDAGLLESLERGLSDVGYGLVATWQMSAGGSDEALRADEAEQAAFAEKHSGIGADIARATPALATYFLTGQLGQMLGGKAGEFAATAGMMYAMNRGTLYRQIMAQDTPTDDAHLTRLQERFGKAGADDYDRTAYEQSARQYATAGAAASAVLGAGLHSALSYAFPGASPKITGVANKLIAKAFTDEATQAVVARLAGIGGNTLSGALMMAVPAVVDDATVQRAVVGEVDTGKALSAGWEAFKHSLLAAGLLSTIPQARPLLHDIGAKLRAPHDVARLDAQVAEVKAVGIAQHAPAEAEAVIARMVEQSDTPTVHVAVEALDPKATEAVVRAVGPEAVAEAHATGAPVEVPIEKYLVQVAPEHHDSLRENVKTSADGMTLAEAKAAEPAAELKAAIPAEAPPEVHAAAETVLKPAAPPEPPAAAVLRAYAEERVKSVRVGDLSPGKYEQAAKRAADKLAEKAKKAAAQGISAADRMTPAAELATGKGPALGDVEHANTVNALIDHGAGTAQKNLDAVSPLEQARDLSRALAKAHADAKKEANSARKELQRFTETDKRAELGRATVEVQNPDGTTTLTQPYLDRVDDLLGHFELSASTSRREVAKRAETMAWIATETAAGRDPIIPDSVLAKLDRPVHWKELTVSELQDLRDAVTSIAAQAKLKNTLVEKGQRVERGRGIDQLVTAVADNVEQKPFRPTGSTVGNLGKVLEKLNGLKYGIRAIERVVNALDGGDINGPWHRLVWDPINDSTHRWHDITRKTTEAVTKVIESWPAEEQKRWRETRFMVNGVSQDHTAAIAVALNSGNASNIAKLEKGWRDDSVARRGLKKWDDTTREQYLKQLTRKDWEFVQKVWDALESTWPESADLEKRLTGLEPPKVERKPFTRTLEDGTTIDLDGGYYPVIYDADFSKAGMHGEEPSSVKIFDANYYRAATPQGRLQTRIEGFARPIELSIDNLPRKITEAAKDIAMRESLISVQSVLTDDRVRAALHTSEVGRGGERALIGWLRDTANDLVIPDNGASSWFSFNSKARGGYTASIFAYNVGQTLQNLTGFVPATAAVGPRWMKQALVEFTKRRGSMADWIEANSGEIRNEDKGGTAFDEALRDVQKGAGAMAHIGRFGSAMFRATDRMVKYTTWLADYMRSTAAEVDGGRGLSHEDAVKQADATVRLHTMAANTKDLPALLRNRLGKLMLPLYSYSMHRLNMAGDAIGGAQNALRRGSYGKAAAVIGGVWGALAIETVLSEIAKGKGPTDQNDDGEVGAADAAIWAAKLSAVAPATWIPIVGNSVKAAVTGRSAMSAPEVSVAVTTGQTVHDLYTAAVAVKDGEEIDDKLAHRLALHLIETSGYATTALTGIPVPVSQIRSTVGYALDENSPKDTPLQIGLGAAFGPKARDGSKLLNLTE